jgi:hypothetical protein
MGAPRPAHGRSMSRHGEPAPRGEDRWRRGQDEAAFSADLLNGELPEYAYGAAEAATVVWTTLHDRVNPLMSPRAAAASSSSSGSEPATTGPSSPWARRVTPLDALQPGRGPTDPGTRGGSPHPCPAQACPEPHGGDADRTLHRPHHPRALARPGHGRRERRRSAWGRRGQGHRPHSVAPPEEQKRLVIV